MDLSRVRREYVDDVQEYLVENDVPKLMEELTPQEFFKYWLEWSGVVGFDAKIVSLLESLGWRQCSELRGALQALRDTVESRFEGLEIVALVPQDLRRDVDRADAALAGRGSK